MKLSDAIEYSYIKTIRDKKNIYFTIILVICCLLITGSISFLNAFFSRLEESNNLSASARSLLVYEKEPGSGFKNLEGIEHILDINDEQGFVLVNVKEYKNDNYDGRIELIYGNEHNLPKNIIGESFSENDTGVAICPINFYPSSMMEYPRGKKNIFLDGNKLLNTTFEINEEVFNVLNNEVVTTGHYSKKFKIIGLYDHIEQFTEPFQCYVPQRDIVEIFNKTMGGLYNEEGEKISCKQVEILVDKYSNVNKVKKLIEEKGFEVNYVEIQNISYQNSIKLTCAIIVLIVILCIVFITSYYVKKNTVISSSNFGVLKALGYSNENVSTLNVCQTIIITAISYIISSLLFITTTIFLKHYLKQYLLYTGHGYYLDQYISTYLTSFIIIIVIPIISTLYFTNKKNKVNINDNIKGWFTINNS